MAQLQINTITPLYWAASSGFIPGRDAMGIQNSSVVVYASLLPGITNLTERIRYYGFYCWLLAQYDAGEGSKDNYRQQFDFIRRAELLIAFYMQHEVGGYSSIPGANFAFEYLPTLLKNGSIDLAAGADKGKSMRNANGEARSYWKYASGAMGQYYAGALLALSLVSSYVKEKSNYFVLTDRGQKLADAFGQSLDAQSVKVLLSIVRSGTLKAAQLEQLAAFDISNIPVGSAEWQAYLELLFQPDSPTPTGSMRLQTLRQYLQVAGMGIPFSRWLLGEYYFQNPNTVKFAPSSASLGWYLYYAQELIHFAIEMIFNSLLLQMKKDRYVKIDEFVESQVMLLNDEMKTRDEIENEQFRIWFTTDYSFSAMEWRDDLRNAYLEQQFAAVFYLALLVIAQTYQQVQPRIQAFREYLNANHIAGKRGNILEIEEYLILNGERPVIDFFRQFVFRILNDHQMVAYDKMGNGEVQVHKFLIEHNHLVQINTIEPRMTTPRLGSVKNILEDLSLLDTETHLPTEEGLALLNR